MSETFWYIVSLQRGAFDSIWSGYFHWQPMGEWRTALASQQPRKTAKAIAKQLRRKYPRKSIRVVSGKDIEPWVIGAALEDEPKVVVDFGKFTTPIIRKVYPPLLAKNIVSVQPMTSPAPTFFTAPRKRKP